MTPLLQNSNPQLPFVIEVHASSTGGPVPEGKTYVPSSQRQILLCTAHNLPGSGHTGSKRTLLLFQAWYWLPIMTMETRDTLKKKWKEMEKLCKNVL